uniref:enoyl-CoA hydratase/isomerase family protein n=1 Tax=Komagataeibacter kakiaceti TaxID=943261 RepID=UPI00055432B7
CPFSLCVTFAAYHAARGLPDLDRVLEQEFRLICHLLRRPDFAEGVRARLIDKDNAPRWIPDDIATVSMPEVMACLHNPVPFSLDLPVRDPDGPFENN